VVVLRPRSKPSTPDDFSPNGSGASHRSRFVYLVCMNLDVIFFDAAGTLITPAESVGSTYARLAGEFGIAVSPEALDAAFRATWKSTAAPFHPAGSPPADDDRSWWRKMAVSTFTRALGSPLEEGVMGLLFDRLYAHYAEPSAWMVYDDVVPTLQALVCDHRLMVLSNFDRRLLSILSGHGLLGYFEAVVLSSEVGASKPHPRIFEVALAKARVPAAACLHVGDDPVCDVNGAQMCGMASFAVKRPGSGFDALIKLVCKG
jgi:putative hydrolase of the HAD superfamily